MSYKTITYLYCDGEDCHDGDPFDYAPAPHGYEDSTATDQRKRAREVGGWTRKNGNDYCFDCSQKMSEQP